MRLSAGQKQVLIAVYKAGSRRVTARKLFEDAEMELAYSSLAIFLRKLWKKGWICKEEDGYWMTTAQKENVREEFGK